MVGIKFFVTLRFAAGMRPAGEVANIKAEDISILEKKTVSLF